MARRWTLKIGNKYIRRYTCTGMLQPGSPLQTEAPLPEPGVAETPAPSPAVLSMYLEQHVPAASSGLSHGAAAGVAGKAVQPMQRPMSAALLRC